MNYISKNGPTVTYELVSVFWPKPVYRIDPDGYFTYDGISCGALVKSSGMGRDMYHRPWIYLSWNHEVKQGVLDIDPAPSI
jgi:hypothetical protein